MLVMANSIIQDFKNKKPQSIDEFKIWLTANFDFNEIKYKGYYEMVTNSLVNDFSKTTFWIKLNEKYRDIDNLYQIKNGVQLFANSNVPCIYIKSLDSLINKAYRKNILENKNFPNKPNGEWVNQTNWFCKVNDILRTTIIVKYLDGVEFLLNEISKIALEESCEYEYSLESKEEGYYAAHFGIKVNLHMYDMDFTIQEQKINVEIQITTELQEIIKNLLHKHYERKRINLELKKYNWQWDFHCEEFSTNYLGHIVHYVEGMIVDIRDNKKSK